MAETTAQLNADFTAILADLAGTDAIDTATVYQADGTTSRGTAETIRGTRLDGEALRVTGWEARYRFSIYLQRSTAPSGFAKNDVVQLEDGDRYRVLEIERDPTGIYLMAHLGDEFVE